jgi:hypothetical protein
VKDSPSILNLNIQFFTGGFSILTHSIRSLSALIRNYGDVSLIIFFHRKGAKDAESPPEADLFAVERKANEK